MKRILWRGAAVLAAVYVFLTAGLYWAMTLTPDTFGRIMTRVPFPFMMVLPFEGLWKHARAGAMHPGAAAPDFRLPTLDHSAVVQLSSFHGTRPVALIFGSYT